MLQCLFHWIRCLYIVRESPATCMENHKLDSPHDPMLQNAAASIFFAQLQTPHVHSVKSTCNSARAVSQISNHYICLLDPLYRSWLWKTQLLHWSFDIASCCRWSDTVCEAFHAAMSYLLNSGSVHSQRFTTATIRGLTCGFTLWSNVTKCSRIIPAHKANIGIVSKQQ